MFIKDYISREYFLKYSNAKNLLIDNLFFIEFSKSNKGEFLNSENFSNSLSIFSGLGLLIYDNIFQFLQQNTFGLTLSDQIATSTTQFINNTRRNTNLKREDKNISLDFIESSDNSVRMVINEWINMTLPEYKLPLYLDDYSVDITIQTLNNKLEPVTKIIYERCFPINYDNIELSLGGEPDIKIVKCEFAWKKCRIIGVDE